MSTEKLKNPGRYREKVESVRVSKNGRIRVSTGKWKDSGEDREKVESVRLTKNCPNEYRKMAESGSVPVKGRIRKRIEKPSERVPKNGRIRVSTGK